MDPTQGGNPDPVGTLEELASADLNPSQFGSCSKQNRDSIACKWYPICVNGNAHLRAIVHGHQPEGHAKPLQGPEQLAIYRQLSPAEGGEGRILEMPCFMYYASGLHERRKQGGTTGEVVKILGVAGNGKKYTFEDRVRKHKKNDPNCDECAQRRCTQTVIVKDTREIEPFRRIADRFRSRIQAAEIRESVLEEVEREQDFAAFSSAEAASDEAP